MMLCFLFSFLGTTLIVMGEVDPRRRSNQARLRAEVHAFLAAFTLAGTGIAIFGAYVGSYYVAAIAASISLLCFSCLLVSGVRAINQVSTRRRP
jgi:hypothetical protein